MQVCLATAFLPFRVLQQCRSRCCHLLHVHGSSAEVHCFFWLRYICRSQDHATAASEIPCAGVGRLTNTLCGIISFPLGEVFQQITSILHTSTIPAILMLLLASPPTTLFILRLFLYPRDVGGDANISKTILEGYYYYSLKHLDSSNPQGVK